MRNGQKDEAEAVKAQTSGLKEKSGELRDSMLDHEKQMNELLYQIPNTPNDLVAAGCNEDDNEVVESWGDIPELADAKKPHWDIAKEKDIIDFDLGAKITGAGFCSTKGKVQSFKED